MNLSEWNVSGIRFDERGYLVIDAEPSYGNRKKWEGEMTFYMTPGQLSDLLRLIEERRSKKEMVEIAVAELMEFNEEAKSEYLKKKASVAAQLNIDVDDIPRDWKWE